MTRVTLAVALLAGAAAFVPQGARPAAGRVARSATDDMNQIFADAVAAEPDVAGAQAVQERASREVGIGEMSIALPFAPRPEMLDGTLAGDVGFDPCGFATSRAELYNQREAEVKHGRLAMLAVAGWPLAELWDGPIARAVGLPSPVEANGGLAPSVLNGGLGKVSLAYWAVVVGFTAAVDLYGQSLRAKATAKDPQWMLTGSYLPGDFGFDPLELYPKDQNGRKRMQLAEIKHGRLAMLAITAFALQEYISKVPVVKETPVFFKPLFSF